MRVSDWADRPFEAGAPVAARVDGLSAQVAKGYHLAMQVVTGTVIGGQVVLQGAALPEGARVTVLARGADEGFTLSVEDEDELLEAIAEIDRGEHVSLNELMQTLPHPT